MSPPRHIRAAVLGAALSAALVAGMAGTAIAFSPPAPPPTAHLVTSSTPVPPAGPAATPAAVAGRIPTP